MSVRQGGIPKTTIYALGNLGDNGEVTRVRKSLGFISKNTGPITMSSF